MSAFTILRHAVPSRIEHGGLSDLQHAMLHDPHPVRVFAAPTGAGKSYAFGRGVVEDALRVLFVVPTRRLAANLTAGLRDDLLAAGLDEAAVARRIAIWTSDERARLEALDPEVRVGRLRVRQLRQRDLAANEGRMILATPESVAHALLRPARPGHGEASVNVADLLRVDHVVFDEFHTTDPRGLGIAAAVAAIRSRMTTGARLTFLSATPIDVVASLVDFGISHGAIATGRETVVTGTPDETPDMRAIHGDVRLEVLEDEEMPALLERRLPALRECLAGGVGREPRQVVVIYDSKRALLRDLPPLGALFDRLGVGPEDRLAINSTSDSVARHVDGGFTVGSTCDPMGFKVLVATSSVEMGVTFRAGLIAMQPGHDAASFVQRVGRVARGDEPGHVIVAAPQARRDRDPWLRELLAGLSELGKTTTIEAFTAACLRGAAERFEADAAAFAAEDGHFARMPVRAAWCAALFWTALRRTWTGTSGIRATLDDFATPKAARVEGWLRRLEREGGTYAEWARCMADEATVLREIEPRVDLVDPNGQRRSVSWSDYASTAELAGMPSWFDGDRLVVEVDEPLDAPGGILARLGGTPVVREVETIWPHEVAAGHVERRFAVEQFIRRMDDALSGRGGARRHRDAVEAAKAIVRTTRIVPAPPRDRRVGPVATGSVIL